MQIERSNVPGYDATLMSLEPAERFPLRNPDDPADILSVSTVVAFDHGSATDGRPYFRAWGQDIAHPGNPPREMDHNFTDPGVLPPHVREAIGREALDHAPQEARVGRPERLADMRRYSQIRRDFPDATPAERARIGIERATQRDLGGRRPVGPPDLQTLARLRTEHNVTNPGDLAQARAVRAALTRHPGNSLSRRP
jgi:hypothetical protein